VFSNQGMLAEAAASPLFNLFPSVFHLSDAPWVVSALLKRRKALGLTGAGLALLATLMGGSEVAVATPVARSNHVGLDWFLLDLFLLSAIFVPIEQFFARNGNLLSRYRNPSRAGCRSFSIFSGWDTPEKLLSVLIRHF